MPDRQPLTGIHVEVSIVGNTVSAGSSITVYTTTGAGVAEYVVQDRTLATKWALRIADRVMRWDAVATSASAEPIIEDNLVPGVYWKLFMDDGIFGMEQVLTVQDDQIFIRDEVTDDNTLVVVSDGIVGNQVTVANSETFFFNHNTSLAGSLLFTNISGITMSGLSSGFYQIRALNRLGQPVNQELLVSTNVPCRFYNEKGRIRMKRPGQEEVADYKIMCEPDLDLRENDLIYPTLGIVGLTFGQITWMEKIFDFAGVTHHLEAEIMDL